MDPWTVPGRVDIKPLEDDPEYTGYWHAYINDTRINGGVCTNYTDGVARGQRAIEVWRRNEFYRTRCWDTESGRWILREQLTEQ